MRSRYGRMIVLLLCAALCTACLIVPSTAYSHAKAAADIRVYRLSFGDGHSPSLVDDFGNEYRSAKPGAAAPGLLPVPKLQAKASDPLPAAYSSVDAGFVTAVKDQMDTGICWAFASLGALETSAVKQGLADRSVDLSEGHLANVAINTLVTDRRDPTYGDGRACGADEIYNGGGNAAIAADAMARGAGPAAEAQYPSEVYMDYRIVMGQHHRYVSDLKLGAFSILDYGRDVPMDVVKRAIMSHGSLTAGFYNASGSFFRENGGPACYYYPLRRAADHDILIVGWDDAFPKEHFSALGRPPADGAFLCKNSWGENDERLDGGYFWLSYADASLDMFCALDALDADAYTKTYQYDGCGWSELITGDGLRAANVFTADVEGYLNRAGFYCMSDSVIRYYVYKGLTDPLDPESGRQVCSGAVACDSFGYQCVPLEKLVHVEKGQTFSLVTESVVADGCYVTAEGLTDSHAEKGQSFLFDGEAWRDMAGTYNNYAAKLMLEPSSRHTHTYRSLIETATCTREARTLMLCDGCDLENVISVEPALGHVWSEPEYDDPDTHTSVCARDASHRKTEPHNWVKTQILREPTCAEPGLSIYACFACSATKRQEEASLPHTPVVLPGHAPTCTQDGVTDSVVCAVCGETISPGETLPSPGHDWSPWRDDPDGGGHLRVCRTDPEHIERQEHDYQTLEIRSVPTCTAPGARVVICSVCGRYDIRPIEPLRHLFGDDLLVTEPTLTRTGFMQAYCSRCGQVRETPVPVLTLDDQNPGDVDLDGRVTAYDARLALRASARLITLKYRQRLNASVRTYDGSFNAADARLILRVSARLEEFRKPGDQTDGVS